jgi:hypothetical protein
MQTIKLLLVLLGFLALPRGVYGQPGHDGGAGIRARIVAEANKLVGIRERGYNRGKEVEAIIREAGGKAGDKWCSWTVVVELRRAGLLVPRFGRARDWFDAAHTIWRNGVQLAGRPTPQPGDLLGFTWGLAIICHVEMLIVWGSGPSCRAVGGNTGGGGALKNDGEGVYVNWRLKRMVAAVANVVDNPTYKR